MRLRIPFLAEITDKFSRENFKFLDRKLLSYSFVKAGFVFFEKSLSANSYPATVNIYHGLSFIPEDVVTTSVKGGTVTWNYSLFTNTYVSATISAATTVRFFLGRYEE